jgi:hypothetical protein
MRPPRAAARAVALAAAALTAAALAAGAAPAAPTTCPGGRITVDAPEPGLAARICRVAEATAAGLARCGLPLPGRVEISVGADLAEGCMGVFHCGEGRIELRAPKSFAAARSPDGPFATLPERAYYDSVVAHEIAHAAHDAVPCPFGTCEVTGEYVAYASQIATLPEAARRDFLAAALDGGPAGRADLSLVMLKLSPTRFAAAAATHLAAQDDSCATIEAIARGDLLFDRERP